VIYIGRKPEKVSRLGADPTWKAMWRMIRSWVCHNHKLYYSYVVLTACGVYNAWYAIVIGYYVQRNHHRSLDVAIENERIYQANKPAEDDDDDEEEEEEE
tara:strand:+ start:228 stop:527 length:300 start_codon:yes stop_codon:yes gene_type:complete